MSKLRDGADFLYRKETRQVRWVDACGRFLCQKYNNRLGIHRII